MNLISMCSLVATGLLSTGVAGAAALEAPVTQPSAEQRVEVSDEKIRGVHLAVAHGGPAAGKRADDLEVVALFYGGPLPTVFDFSQDGSRAFVAFPRWTQPTNFTVAEIRDGMLQAFPGPEVNKFLPDDPDAYSPQTHLVSVQSVVVDAENRLWLLDTGSINLGPPIEGGPKLWGYDLSTNERVKAIDFADSDVILEKTYLNDVRFDLSRGEEGYAFITDSGEGGIIVVDLATNEAWRKLDGHPSVKADESVTLEIEGEPLMMRPPDGEPKPVMISSDGIALSPDRKTLWYAPITSHELFSVEVDALVDPEADAAATVKKVAAKESAHDGIVSSANGQIYTTAFEANAIHRIDPESGETETVVQDERILWPDCVIVRDGYVYFMSNQLDRQPQFHNGQSRLEPPFVLFRYPVEEAERIEGR